MTGLRVEVDGGVALWTIDRPGGRNTASPALLGDLLDAAREAAADDRVRVVVTAATGRTWCGAADPENATDGAAPDQPAGVDSRRWVPAFRALEKPLVAAVDGAVAGGGFALFLLHDIRIASERACFTAGCANLGVAPELGLSWFLPRLVGPGAAADLLLTGRVVDADGAHSLGLVQRIAPARRAKDEALFYAARLARLSPPAARATVAALRGALDRPLAAQLEVERRNGLDCTAASADEPRARVRQLLARTAPGAS